MNISIIYIYYLFSFIFFYKLEYMTTPKLLILMELAFILTKLNYNITYKKKIIITYFQKQFYIYF